MMTNLALQIAGSSVRLYISVEKHMACGIGACNGCNVSVKDGNRKACTDGPVFLAEEVKLDDLHEL
ncbi:Dihydroorotate dehydrogenase B (NAD(+)), electron transfer subunit [compost metagenome]